MRITPVDNFNHKKQGKQELVPSVQNAAVKPSFKGVPDGLIRAYEIIDRGGFAASFIISDALATTFPRIFQATERGREQTGKRNYKAAAEVSIREFATGPSMFAIPLIILKVGSKLTGSANNIPMDSIMKFSDALSEAKTGLSFKESFYEKAFELMAKNTFEKDAKSFDAKKYARMLIEAEAPDVPKRKFFQRVFNKPLEGSVLAKDQLIDNIVDKLCMETKRRVPYHLDFTAAKLGTDSKSLPFETLISQMQDYAGDAVKYVEKNASNGGSTIKAIQNFKNSRVLSRFVTNPVILLATAAFLTYIPKLYSFNKTNPETEALYEEIGQNRKGAVNAGASN